MSVVDEEGCISLRQCIRDFLLLPSREKMKNGGMKKKTLPRIGGLLESMKLSF